MINQGGGEAATLFFDDLGEKTQIVRLILLLVDMFLGDIVIVCVYAQCISGVPL